MAGKHKHWSIGDDPPTIVPAADEMDDETFLKHLELRHAEECLIENYISRHNVAVWVGMYRTFHDRLHALGVPGQHDHEHESEIW